jgi:signal transduction histidine kinase
VKLSLPRSLVGQMALLIGSALLLAQLANFLYLLVERQQFNRAEIDTPAITRFTSTAADFDQAAPEFRSLVLNDASRRGSHYDLGQTSAIGTQFVRRSDTEQRLQQSLATAGVEVSQVRAAIDLRPDPRHSQIGGRRSSQMLLSAQLKNGSWINARLAVPRQPPLITPEIAVGTLLLYLFVLLATVGIAVRLARPLRRLTRAAEAFRGRNQPVTVEPSGPADLRNAILAFNAMNERVVGLLEEKDRTLGAIGHDLRTPLASLRIRAESVQPEEDRDRMIGTIQEMTATLEDILTLARVGRSREQFEQEDVTKLARAIVEDYRETGQAVRLDVDGAHALAVQPAMLRRALRNLIDNALKYGGSAEVQIRSTGDAMTVTVLDQGPGLPAEELDRVTGAFYRGEPSRNRDTGGAGLGLSIAQAVADAHGGKLTFSNRQGGGLVASISLPNGQYD